MLEERGLCAADRLEARAQRQQHRFPLLTSRLMMTWTVQQALCPLLPMNWRVEQVMVKTEERHVQLQNQKKDSDQAVEELKAKVAVAQEEESASSVSLTVRVKERGFLP